MFDLMLIDIRLDLATENITLALLANMTNIRITLMYNINRIHQAYSVVPDLGTYWESSFVHIIDTKPHVNAARC